MTSLAGRKRASADWLQAIHTRLRRILKYKALDDLRKQGLVAMERLKNAVMGFLGLIGRLFRYIERIVIGLWLLVLYGIAGLMVLGTLSSFQFQSRVSEIASKEEVLTIISLQHEKIQFDSEMQSFDRDLRRNLRDLDRLRLKLKNLADIGSPTSAEIEELRQTRQDIDNKNQRVKELRGEIDIKQKEIDRVTRSENLGSTEQAKLKRSLAADFSYLQRILFFDNLVLMPTQMLTLVLTISMGALGSVIHLTWEFFDKAATRRFSWYVFRPFLGALLAFSIFILLKSGQLIISSPQSAASQGVAEDLNPFFISFLAIISGILSEQAYARISAAGTRILAPPTLETRRWIRTAYLEAALAEREKDWSQVSKHTDVSENEAKTWKEGTSSVPEAAQRILAAWLDVPIRDLFTDQPPEGISPTPS